MWKIEKTGKNWKILRKFTKIAKNHKNIRQFLDPKSSEKKCEKMQKTEKFEENCIVISFRRKKCSKVQLRDWIVTIRRVILIGTNVISSRTVYIIGRWCGNLKLHYTRTRTNMNEFEKKFRKIRKKMEKTEKITKIPQFCEKFQKLRTLKSGIFWRKKIRKIGKNRKKWKKCRIFQKIPKISENSRP